MTQPLPTETVVASEAASASPVAPVRGAGWLLLLLVLLNLLNYIDRYNLPPVIGPIQQEFFAPGDPNANEKMGRLATGFVVVYMLTAPIFGLLADRYSRWALVGIGMLVQSLGTFGSGFAPTFAVLLISRCVVGIGDAAYGPAAPTIISDLYPVEKRGRMLAWFYAALPVGSALGFGLGGLMHGLTGNWRWGFHVLVPIMATLGVICLFIRDKRIAPRTRHAAKLPWDQIRGLLRNRSYVINCAAQTAMTFAIGGISYWMPKYLTDVYLRQYPALAPEDFARASTITSLGFSAVVVVAGLGATLAGGWAGDRLRGRFGGSYFLVSGAGMLVGFPLLLLILVTPFPAVWGVIFLAVFALFFNTGPSNTALANVVSPAVRASAFALNIFIIHLLGDALSPWIIGVIADRSSLAMGFVVVSGTVALGGALWLIGMPFLAADTARAEAPDLAEPRGFEVLAKTT
ncbi:MAG TPA: MFS transporter [Tepidisphaeraceae bacterium]|jgi:predicted MFS family arabinose efflux permease